MSCCARSHVPAEQAGLLGQRDHDAVELCLLPGQERLEAHALLELHGERARLWQQQQQQQQQRPYSRDSIRREVR